MGLIANSLRTAGPLATSAPQVQPQQAQGPKPPIAAPTDHPSALGFLGNLWDDVQGVAEGLGTTIGTVAHDASYALQNALGNHPSGGYLGDDMFDAMVGMGDRPSAILQDYKARYGGEGLDEVRHQLYENPLSYLSDIATVASLGGSAAVKGANIVGRTPEVANALKVIGDATTGLNGAEWGARVDELQAAAKAGELGGVSEGALATARTVAKVRGLPRTVVDYSGGGTHDIPAAANPYRRIYTNIGAKLGRLPIDKAEGVVAGIREASTLDGVNTGLKVAADQLQASINTARRLGLPGIEREYWSTVRIRRATDTLLGTAGAHGLHDRDALIREVKDAYDDSGLPTEVTDEMSVENLMMQDANLYDENGRIRDEALAHPAYTSVREVVPVDETPEVPAPMFSSSGPEMLAEAQQTRMAAHERLAAEAGWTQIKTEVKGANSLNRDVMFGEALADDGMFPEQTVADVARGQWMLDSWKDLPAAFARLRNVAPIRGGFNTLLEPDTLGHRGMRVVLDIDGKPFELRFVTPQAAKFERYQAELRDFAHAAEASIKQGMGNPTRMLAELEAAKRKLVSLNEPTTAELREVFEGIEPGPMNKLNWNLSGITARFESGMYRTLEGAFTPLKALERQYLPMRIKGGAELMEDGSWKGGGTAFELDTMLRNAGIPSPVYFPFYDPSRAPANDFLMAKKTVGMRTLSKPGTEKAFTGELLRSGRYSRDIVDVYSRRAAQAVRREEALDLVNKMTSTFGRKINRWEEKGDNEQLMAPDGFLRFYRGQAKLTDDLVRAAAVKSGVELEDEMIARIKEFIVSNQDDYIGLTRQGVEMWAVPKIVAERIQKASDRIGGVNARLFYDTPMQLWRSLVLQGSPRWVLNNLIGNTTFLKMQGGKLTDVIRQLNPQFLAKIRAYIGEDALADIESGGFFDQQRKTHLGVAADTHTGKIYQRMGESKTTGVLSKPGRWVGRLNGIVEDAYRRASYLTAAEKEAQRAGISRTAHRFWTSKAALEDVARVGLDERLYGKAIKEMNYFMNDYAKQTPFQRNIMRRFVAPFWSFYRHVGKLMLTMPFEHPERFTLMRMLAQVGQEMQDDFGVVPDWAHGAVPIGPGDDPGTRKFLSTSGPNPFSTLFSTFVDVLNPAFKVGLEQSQGRSALTDQPFSDIAVGGGFGMDQKFRVTQGPDGKYTPEPIERTSPSILEHVLQQVPQYQLARNLIGGGKPYDTANLYQIAKGRITGTHEGVITDPATGEPQYGTTLAEQAGKYVGYSTFDVDQQALAEQLAEGGEAAVRQVQRRIGALPPADAGGSGLGALGDLVGGSIGGSFGGTIGTPLSTTDTGIEENPRRLPPGTIGSLL